MINEKMYGLGDEPSAIRELFAYGMARKAEIGAENVFDFSIGNPSVPAPELVRETMLELLDMDPVALHAYSPAAGCRGEGGHCGVSVRALRHERPRRVIFI